MRFLLTNDDGIDGEGLKALAEAFKEHEVWIIAPDRNRSAVSNGITMKKPLSIKKIKDKVYSCSGLPVDCSIIGIKSLVKGKIDAVLSGINKGANLGTDILYSGTAAAARQASLYGIPGIAFSLESKIDSWNYKPLADFAVKNIDKLIAMQEINCFVNVNSFNNEVYKGVKLTVPAERDYKDSVHVYETPDGELYSFFIGGNVETKERFESDENAARDGYISVSVICSQPSCAGFESKKNKWGNTNWLMS